MERARSSPYAEFTTDHSYQIGIDRLIALAQLPAGASVIDLGQERARSRECCWRNAHQRS